MKRCVERDDKVEIVGLSEVHRLFEEMCGRLRVGFGSGFSYDRVKVVDLGGGCGVWKYEFGWKEWGVLVELTRLTMGDWRVTCVVNTMFWRVPLVFYRFVVRDGESSKDRIEENLNKIETSLRNYLLDGE